MDQPQESSAPTISGFAILSRIGEGGMGSVFLARELASEREVAIKLLTPRTNARDANCRARFRREARVMTQVSHPNIVAVIDHGTVADGDYIVMEYVEGRSLREILTNSGRLEPAAARPILEGLSAALGCLHAQRIVHRDLKPGNILIDRAGRVKLSDFGISAPVAELGDITTTGQFVGSLDYMAPEQRTRLPIDERADQFSLAVIAYELLTGKRPVGTYKSPSTINRRLGGAVDSVLARALEEDPDDRFSDAASFVDALLTALSRRSRRRHATALPGIATVLVAGTLWIWSTVGEANAASPGATHDIPHPDVDLAMPATAGKPPQDPDGRSSENSTSQRIDYYIALADKHLAGGNLEAATAALTEAIRLDGEDADLFRRRSLVHKHNRLYQSALDDLARARKLDPTLADAWVGAGSIYVMLKDYGKAIELLDEAIDKDPSLATAFAWRGWSQHGAKHDDLALRDLDQAIRLDGDCGIAYQFRGILAKLRKDYPAAHRDYSAFARCEPDDPYAHRTLASLLALCPDRKLRNGKLAVRHARRACELTQWKSWAELRTLAYAYAEDDALDAAVDNCDKALALAPENRRRQIQSQRKRYRVRLRKNEAGSK